jgi:Protein of unknown function (DUF1579)
MFLSLFAMSRFTRRFVLQLLCIFLNSALLLYAETPTQDVPRDEGPPPELQHFNGTIGIWDTTTKYRFAPEMPIFESRSVETVRWGANKQFLISEQHGLMPDGWINALGIITWIPRNREYKVVELYQTGEVLERTMEIEGNLRKVIYYRRLEGRLIRSELTGEEVSDTEYKFHCECTDEGKTWRFSEGVSRKRSIGK